MDPDPELRSRRQNHDHKKEEKVRNFMFEVMDVLLGRGSRGGWRLLLQLETPSWRFWKKKKIFYNYLLQKMFFIIPSRNDRIRTQDTGKMDPTLFTLSKMM